MDVSIKQQEKVHSMTYWCSTHQATASQTHKNIAFGVVYSKEQQPNLEIIKLNICRQKTYLLRCLTAGYIS